MVMPSLRVILLLLFFLSDSLCAEAQTQSQEVVSSSNASDFKPGVGILMGVLSITFLLACILLVYARFFLDTRSSSVTPGDQFPRLASGIGKSVIDSLPFFRFSSLKGSKDGLECSVCLSRFEDVEILRLLPQCKHAFHVGCIDRWLEEHSSCPLCRERLNPDDPRMFTYSSSTRFLLPSYSRSIARDDTGVETELQPHIQREVEESHWSSRFGIGSSLRRLLGGGKNSAGNRAADSRDLHRFNHRILVPQVFFNNRWSDIRLSDFMFLNSEMIHSNSSDNLSRSDARWPGKSVQPMPEDHFITVREEMELKRSIERKLMTINVTASSSNSDAGGLALDEKRSMSEIPALPRLSTSSSTNRNDVTRQDRTRSLWLPIAKRTVEWFANREKRSEEPQNQFSENTTNV